MSDRERIKVGERTYDLSIAVKLVDGVTGEQPSGKSHVRIETVDAETVDAKPIRTPSGYYLFFGIPNALDVIRIHVEAGDEYQTVTREEDFAALRSAKPQQYEVEIRLAPTTAYRFSTGRTLVRGHVWEATAGTADPENRVPVPGAGVTVADVDSSTTVPGRGLSTRTTPKGEFVLYFERFTEDHLSGAVHGVGLVEDGGKRLVKINGRDPTIRTAHPQYRDGSVTSSIVENAVLIRDVDIAPK